MRRELYCPFSTFRVPSLVFWPICLFVICIQSACTQSACANESGLTQPDFAFSNQNPPITTASLQSPEPDQQFTRSPQKLPSTHAITQPVFPNQGPVVSVSGLTVDFYEQPVVQSGLKQGVLSSNPIRQVAAVSSRENNGPRPIFDEGDVSALNPTTLPQHNLSLSHQQPTSLSRPSEAVGSAKSTSSTSAQQPSPQSSQRSQPLKPTVDTDNQTGSPAGTVHLQSAAFLGMRPGKSTVEDIAQKLGAPQKVTQLGQKIAQLYSIDEMSHVEILLNENVIESIEVVFGESYPVEQVREVFAAELEKIRSVSFADEKGDVIGLMFPEKGVTLVYTPSQEAGVPSQMVQKLVIMPIFPEPFIIRARGYQEDSPSATINDLKQALSLSPNNPEVYWLLSQIELQSGDIYDALKHCEMAIEQNQSQLQYHITLAKILIALNQLDEAQQYLEELLPLCDRLLHHKAVVHLLLGDVIRDNTKNCGKAFEHHKAALDLADQLRDNSNLAVQTIAREVLVNTQLSIIKDIVQGNWENKDVAIEKWLLSVREMLKDPQIANKKRLVREYAFRIALTQLAAQTPNSESLTLEQTIQDAILAAQELINIVDDPIYIRRTQWDLGLALFDAVQAFQRKKQYLLALKYGEATIDLMEQGIEGRTNEWDYYALARLYLRLGAIHATGMKNYKAAVVWFDRTRPLFDDLSGHLGVEESGKIGEMLVLMGVSYWETDQQKEAIRLSEQGLAMIQTAVERGYLDSRKLLAPYTNLETMYNKLNEKDKATVYAQKAALLRESLSSTPPNQYR